MLKSWIKTNYPFCTQVNVQTDTQTLKRTFGFVTIAF